ncbi:hypothetical protein OIU78_022407 [Salix suchowensis]|nr:hypothetical protein OIU78_022407 [Salix suchowensis]
MNLNPPPPSSHYYQEPPQPPRPYFQEANYAPVPPPPFQETQVVRTSHHQVYSKAKPDFHLTIRDGKVILARSNPSDEFQNWFKDEKYSVRVKDSEGYPAFALVNKATGQAIKHSIGEAHPVRNSLRS